jgi:hypothetical protein
LIINKDGEALMNSSPNINDFMGGIYIIEFESTTDVDMFIERFRGCPVWPIVTRGIRDGQVFILAIELKKQKHGDFSQQNNTLVKNPHFLGAKKVIFKRDDNLVEILEGHKIETGYASKTPCRSNCKKCPRYQNSCQGCPALYKYKFDN